MSSNPFGVVVVGDKLNINDASLNLIATVDLNSGAAATLTTVESLLYAAMAQGILQSIVFFIYLRSRFGEFWRGFEWRECRKGPS